MIASLDALLDRDQISIVADVIAQPVKAHLDSFTTAAGHARRVIKDGRCRDGEELMAIKSFGSDVAACNKAKALLTQMLATLAKASKH